MHKVYEYWNNRCRWFVFWYFVIEFALIVMDKSLMMGIAFYFFAVPFICESSKIDFDFGRTYQIDMSVTKKLLPLKKNTLAKFYLFFPLTLTVLTGLLLMLAQAITNYRHPFYLDIMLYSSLLLGVYILILIYDYYKTNPSYMFQKTKEIFYVLGVVGFLLMVLTFNMLQDEFYSLAYDEISGRFWIIIFGFSIILLLVAFSSKDKENSIKEREGKQKIDKSLKSIARLSKYTYDKRKLEVLPAVTIGFLLAQLFMNNNLYRLGVEINVYLITIIIGGASIVLKVCLSHSFSTHFSGVTYIKLIPCSKKRLFQSALYAAIVNFVGIMMVLLVILFAISFINNHNLSFINSLKIGHLVEIVLLLYISSYSTIVGFSKNDETFYSFIGLALIILLLILIGYYFEGFNQYWYAYGLGVGVLILGTYKQIFTSYRNFAKQN